MLLALTYVRTWGPRSVSEHSVTLKALRSAKHQGRKSGVEADMAMDQQKEVKI
jgi:hypothetical protein